MIAFAATITDRNGRLEIDVRAESLPPETPAEKVAANIMHHALKHAVDEIAAQEAAGEYRWDDDVRQRLTRRPK